MNNKKRYLWNDFNLYIRYMSMFLSLISQIDNN